MAKNFRSNVYEGGLNVDPRSGAGIIAPNGSLLPNSGSAMLWQKFRSAPDTAWRRITDLGLNNIVDFGAVGDGVTDNRLAITTAIADAVANNIAGIFIPEGIFNATKAPASTFSFDLTGIDNFMVMGRGNNSQIRMVGDGQNTEWAQFLINGGSGIKFKDLFLDGNRFALVNADPLTTLINITNAGVVPSIWFDIDNVEFWRSFGDGLRLAGSALTLGTSQINVRNSRFMVNGRNGVSVQRGTGLIQICNNYFNNNINLDFNIECTGSNSATDVLFSGNQIYAANGGGVLSVQTIGVSNVDPNARITFSGNEVFFGNAFFQNNVEFEGVGNTIISTTASAQPTVAFRRNTADTVFTGNTLLRPTGSPAEQVLSFIGVNGIQPERVVAQSNTITQQSAATCVEFDCNTFNFSGNLVRFDNAQVGVSAGVLVRAVTAGIFNAKVDHNTIESAGGGSLDSCIHFNCNPGDIESCSAIGNSLSGAANGVRLETPVGGGFNTFPVISLNNCDVTVTEILGLNTVAAIVVAGNGSTSGVANGCAQFLSVASPVGVFDAEIGSTCMSQAGGPSTTFFVKEAVTAAGWVGK